MEWRKTEFNVSVSERYATPVTKKSVSTPIKHIIEELGMKTITPHGLRQIHATILMSK